MKPKIKGNTSLMLLLLFFSLVSRSTELLSDTIIIDGEKIFIEKNPRYVDVDSLEQSYKKADINYGLSLTPFLNANFTYGQIAYIGEDARYINDFISTGDSWKLGPGFGLMVEKEIDEHFAFSLGFSWNQSKIGNQYVDVSSLSDEETYKFESFKDGELSHIINQFIDPGYELDTIPVSLNDGTFELQTRDIVARIRIYGGKEKDDLRWYFQFGPFWRSIHFGNVGPVTMIFEDDSLSTWNPDVLELRKTQWGGTFGGGGAYKWNLKNGLSAGVDLWIPAGVLSKRSDLDFSYRSLSLFLGYSRYF
ncbi:MAG: hypothetical protein SGI87_13135 [Flavobacteriales bacterium]|nr:hypothetical protein [Flavobacteriales bacterium]